MGINLHMVSIVGVGTGDPEAIMGKNPMIFLLAVVLAFSSLPFFSEEESPVEFVMHNTAAAATIEPSSKRIGEPGSYVPGEIIVSFSDGRNIEGQVRTLKEELCSCAKTATEKNRAGTSGIFQLASKEVSTTNKLRVEIIDVDTFSHPLVTATVPDELTVEQAIAIAEAKPGVISAQANYVYEPASVDSDSLWIPNDPLIGEGYNDQWWLYRTKAVEAWNNLRFPPKPDMSDLNTVTVAVIDTGVDLYHPDLNANLDVTNAWDAVSGKPLSQSDLHNGTHDVEEGGHGTDVAATIAAVADNDIGNAGITNNRVRVLPINASFVEPGTGRVMGTSQTVLDAVKQVIAYKEKGMNIRAMNLSISYDSGITDSADIYRIDPALYEALCAAKEAGILPVAAAGNGDATGFCAPSDFDVVVSVTGALRKDVFFGSRNQKKTITAPASILSIDSTKSRWSYQYGTSYSAPMVTGAAALLCAADPSLTAYEVEQILLSTAEDIGEPGQDDYYGHGMLDVKAALEAVYKTQEGITVLNATVSTIAAQTYSGSTKRPIPTLTYNEKALQPNIDYSIDFINNTDAGTAALTITGIGNFTGTRNVSFDINKAAITAATVDLISPQMYTGSELAPAPTVAFGGKILIADRDYTLSYADNVDPGIACVTIAGIGNFTGRRTVSFVITQ